MAVRRLLATVEEFEAGGRRAVASVADRLESVEDCVDRVREADGDARSQRLRDASVEALSSRARAAVTDRASETLESVLADRLADTDLKASVDEVTDRGLEAFLRRYRLDETRLDEHTLETIREAVAAELGTEAADRLEELLEEGALDDENGSYADAADELAGTSDEGSAAPTEAESDDPATNPLVDAVAGFRAALDLESESPTELLGAIRERDAVAVGHAVERALEEAKTGLEAASADDRDAALETADSLERSASDGSDAPGASLYRRAGGPITPDASGETTRAIVAAAAVALLARSETGPADGSLVRALPALASTVAGGDAGATARTALDLVGELLLSTESLDLSTFGSRSKGSKALVALFVANLVAMGVGAWLSHRKAPPIPDEIRGPDGDPIVTAEQVRLGKKAFQANGLMNHGSVLGNGSYFGADLTADALERKAAFMRDYYARERGAGAFDDLEAGAQAAVEERVERELDADAPEGAVATYSAAEADAHRRIREEYVDRYYGGAPERGVPQGFVDSAEQAARIADFALWTAWMSHTNRPESDHSYTNDWPYVPAAGNRPTGQVLVWSTISVVLLIAGGGAGVWAYHAYDFAEPTTELVDVPSPDSVSITPTQYAAAWYVPVAGGLFLAQALVGALLAHYYVERTGFYGIGDALGIDVVSLLPFSIGRTWHVNLAVLWITTLWLAGGLFLPGLFTDSDPPWQAAAATLLLGALVVSTVGAFAGVWLGMQGKLGSPDESDRWWWFGAEGLEYLETGRVWKVGLLGALVGWTGLVLRSVRRLDEPPTGLGHFMTYAGGSIALMFGASMLYTPETNMAVTEFWRWWVVHMWVEGVFEFFVTAVVSVALVSMDLLEQADAERAILFEVFAIMAAGIVGVSHHYWWVGLPDVWVPIGTTFSTLEFVPLIFVLYRSFGEYRTLQAQGESFPYTLPLLFIVGSSVWNFVGGGVLGFFVNLPVINYFEHGTYLTVAHAHTATFGAFGLLALGLGTYVLRVVTPEEAWNPTWFRGAFWLTNVGLTVMTVASLLPIGFRQLQAAYQEGYATARSLAFYERDDIQTLLWARTLGDTPMILGALAFTVGAVRHLWTARGRPLEGEPRSDGWLALGPS
ncbi:cbb3-type cytochrome c oxidase subunit I [Halopiger goleimassiliensis]|uniref:cbb3-type cytochrome c oxidase subunit I n=1 Tax=Halopiger goleimassiliensis TaxID=1293048 RepID=UPI00067777B0|nr:cbb3-type cytochrome c oxidase subunit I [Halopiger goleimassiliensis]